MTHRHTPIGEHATRRAIHDLDVEILEECDRLSDFDPNPMHEAEVRESSIWDSVRNDTGGEEETIEEDELKARLQAQRDYCDRLKIPHFAPLKGICYSCRKQIYVAISLKKAGTEHITGCPLCCRTYCD